MAVPKRKTSKQRKHTRAANWTATAPTLVECPQCHELKVAHMIYYVYKRMHQEVL